MYTVASHCSSLSKCRTIAYRVKQSGLHCSPLFCLVLHLANVEQLHTEQNNRVRNVLLGTTFGKCQTMANNRQTIVLLGTTFGKCKTMQNIVPRIVSPHIPYIAIERLFSYAGAPLRCGVAMCCVEVSQFVTLRHLLIICIEHM